MPAYTYIIKCVDGTFYTGWTNDLEKRIAAHNSGKGAKYTRGRCPVELVYYEEYSTSRAARVRECQIKKLGKNEKKKLIVKKPVT